MRLGGGRNTGIRRDGTTAKRRPAGVGAPARPVTDFTGISQTGTLVPGVDDDVRQQKGATVVEVNERSANWRLFGGGGLALGGLLGTIGVIVGVAGVSDALFWLWTIGVLLVGVALLFVAFGQTGSNGAVGALGWGKAVLVIAAAAAIVYAVLAILSIVGVEIPGILAQVLFIVLVVFLLLSAVAIYGRGVAKGIAKWALFVPVVAGILLVIDSFVSISGGFPWVTLLFSLALLFTGVFYLFNKVDVGK